MISPKAVSFRAMIRRALLPVLLTLLLPCTAASARNRPDDPRPEVTALPGHYLNELAWLEGTWVAQPGPLRIECMLSNSDGNSIIGMVRGTQYGEPPHADILFTEMLILKEFPEGISLTYRIMDSFLGQPKDEVVSMVLTTIGDNTATFNATDEMGDLRQITWTRNESDLTATIIDDSGDKPVEEKLVYSLVPCDDPNSGPD